MVGLALQRREQADVGLGRQGRELGELGELVDAEAQIDGVPAGRRSAVAAQSTKLGGDERRQGGEIGPRRLGGRSGERDLRL